ncbi:EAL domain-containing protein [Sphingomonas bacterium]|uniref:EAL domain-containing protein n=1 Tax=Sphingomonas bacterium TaxID=1895847 RepID=UPI002613D963|nr:EAL domain-containing protein [Sphingomonas bacterium]
MLAAAALGGLVGVTGAGGGLEKGLQDLRFQLRSRPASGELHIIEIDARSMAAIARWPWPRRNYAQAIDRLTQAGVAGIAFDVDFSARSNPEDDRRFADALARAGGGVVLPTLRQAAGSGSAEFLDALPIPELRAHSMAAAVSILPDRDGLVRAAPIGIVTTGVPRPSLSAMLAGRAGAVGRDFSIDYAIRADTIPRHSFIDISDGRFDPRAIAGKRVLIGATAVEMGDRYAVPRYGVIPGVVIQALAAETLMIGVPVDAGWVLPLIVALLLALLLPCARRTGTLIATAALLPAAIFAISVAAEMLQVGFMIVPALAALAAVTVATGAMLTAATLRTRRLTDEATGLRNRHALLAHAGDARVTIAVALFADYDKLLSALGDLGGAEAIGRVRDRIALLAGNPEIFRVDDRVLAWVAPDDPEQTFILYEQLRRVMMAPVEVGGRRADVALTVGVAHGDAAGVVLAHAALAAAQARDTGEGFHHHIQSEADAVAQEMSLLGELDQAIAAGEIEVVYQPKLNLATKRIASVEALVRWRHPTRGFLRPDLFIPLAERNDRIAGLTLHVTAQTLAALTVWGAAGHLIGGAVNISAKLLTDRAFLADLAALIGGSGLDAGRLTLEVTESAAMSDPAGAADALRALKALGVRISMDDYGTGQSTLTYLKQLPLDELKLDRSFVQFAHQNRSDAVLVRSTVELAHDLGLTVVAEGVEDAACLAYLASIGCDLAQGYLISKPIGAEALATLLDTPLDLAA